jgi:cation:H+ antiporter
VQKLLPAGVAVLQFVRRAVNSLLSQINNAGLAAPWFFMGLFLASSFLMIWRLEAMSKNGMEGTVLGTLIMPYCSGLGNLIFAFLIATSGGRGEDVMINCLVNNVTNLTLLIGLPAIFWGMIVVRSGEASGKKRKNPAPQLNRLSLLLTLAAVVFFTGATWALGRDGTLDFGDGLVLVGLFLFWQCVHVFEVLKNNVRQNKSLRPILLLELALLGIGAYGIYISIDWLVTWISGIQTGFISAQHLGWLSGWLMVLPNALLAFYYGWRNRPEIIYTSQVGDGHICIPLAIGLFALFRPLALPDFFQTGILLLIGAAALHFVFVALMGKLPRLLGFFLVGAYGYFVYRGLL